MDTEPKFLDLNEEFIRIVDIDERRTDAEMVALVRSEISPTYRDTSDSLREDLYSVSDFDTDNVTVLEFLRKVGETGASYFRFVKP
jgi:hypothetical protein